MTKDNPQTLPTREIFDAVFQYGKNSTSFLTLYSGFKYFTREISGEKGTIAYVETPTAWVGAADPIGPTSILTELLLSFGAEARKVRKAAVMLPVSKETAEFARSSGFYTLQIGNEPWFSLDSFKSPDSEYLLGLHVAKQLHGKGAVVERFDPTAISANEHLELESITRRWLDHHASVPLEFLNRVEPWLYVHRKSYFRVLYHGHQVGYLAAVPIASRNSWYLVDLIRSPDSPLGTTELLVAEAIEQLKKEGVREVTLGMSPLAGVSASERKFHPRMYRLSDFVFEHCNFLYHFKPLFAYKEKFKPTRWEPQYLIAFSPRMSWRGAYGLFRAIAPKGILGTLAAVAWKSVRNIKPAPLSKRLLSGRIVLCSPPQTWMDSIFRCKGVAVLTIINILFFLFAMDPVTHVLRPKMADLHGYSWQHFALRSFQIENPTTPILSSFLHWNAYHLGFNLTMLVLFGGFLELIAGSNLLGICYLIGIIFSNPVTTLLIAPFLYIFNQKAFLHFIQDVDVGCSLGVFACIGALAYFSRRPAIVSAIVVAGICIYAFFSSNLLGLNHIVALTLGFVFAHHYVPKK